MLYLADSQSLTLYLSKPPLFASLCKLPEVATMANSDSFLDADNVYIS